MSSSRTVFKLPNTLTFRLTLWYASTFALFLLMSLFGLYLVINSLLNERIRADLNDDITDFRQLFINGGAAAVTKEIQKEADELGPSEGFIRLLDNNGIQLEPAYTGKWPGMMINPYALNSLPEAPAVPVYDTFRLSNQEYDTAVAYGLIGPDMILHIGESTEHKDELMMAIFSVFFILFVIVVPTASVIGWLMARQAVHGINEVSDAALDIESGKLDRRVDVTGQKDEVQRLADTFNAMAQRIRELISEMREMTDNIAHDLRSPLGRIRAISEVMLSNRETPELCRNAASDTLEECDRLIQMINSTLDVAEEEARLNPRINEKINMVSLAEEACELFDPVAEQMNIDLTCRLEPDCNMLGDRDKLQRMLANLLDNALKYTPPQGSVTVDLEIKDEQILLKVTDNGIGIPTSDQNRVFDRFYRCDQSRNRDGCGLGLSFARAVARAHGGDITLTSTPTESSTFIVRLPC